MTELICGSKISNKIVKSQTADNRGVEVRKENCFGQSKNGRDQEEMLGGHQDVIGLWLGFAFTYESYNIFRMNISSWHHSITY
jgi:hypothetical protein